MPTFCADARKINLRPEDKTINGRCIQCGECCSNFLPMTAAEMDRVARYVAEKGIKQARHFPVVLVQQPLDMCCPFLDVNKPKEKCSIYPVLPSICRHLYRIGGLKMDKPIKNLTLEEVAQICEKNFCFIDRCEGCPIKHFCMHHMTLFPSTWSSSDEWGERILLETNNG